MSSVEKLKSPFWLPSTSLGPFNRKRTMLDHIDEEVYPAHPELTALPPWDSAYNPNRPSHTRHGSQDPVLIKDIFSKETIDNLIRGDRSGANSPEKDEENPRHTRMMWWLIVCLVVLLILAIILGAVLGTFLNNGNSSPSPSVTEIPAGQTTGPASSSPTPPSPVHIASLAVTGYSVSGTDGYFTTWLFWQNSKGYLSRATFNSTTGNWTRVTNFVEARSRTPMTASSMNAAYYKDQPNYNLGKYQFQAQVIYLDEANRVNAWEFPDTGAMTGEMGTLNRQEYMALEGTQLASYWPDVLYQGMSGEIRAARFACYTEKQCWNDDVLATTPALNGSHLAAIPTQNNLSALGVFYQEEDGRYVNYLEDENVNQSSSIWSNDAFSGRIPLNASVAAFSTTRKDSDSLNIYLLWQDNNGTIWVSWADDDSGWKGPITFAAFAGAEKGSALTCLTGLTFPGFPLADGTELARCYFQTGAAVREVSFDGTTWDIVGVVPIEL